MRAYFTIGIPCSGKSAWSERLISQKENIINFSRTDIRNSMIKKKGKSLFDTPKDVRAKINITIDEISRCLPLICNLDVIFDNTNLVWSRLSSNAAHYYNNGWDVTFVIFPAENVVLKHPSQEKMLQQYHEMFSENNREHFENFVDAYGIEIIYITNEEQYELLHNDVERRG